MRHKLLLVSALCLLSCTVPEISGQLGTNPPIWPDYAEVTVPDNIAPLNFSLTGNGTSVAILGDGQIIRARKGLFKWKERLWRDLLESSDSLKLTLAVRREGRWLAYNPICIHISHDRIDPWLSYRLIPPGYQGWHDMGLYQRHLESFDELEILSNSRTDGNCINCHTVPPTNDPSAMLFHSRAEHGGTLIAADGSLRVLDTKTDSTISSFVYPSWHPDGKHVAFSVNKTLQAFYNCNPDRVEVYDEASDVVIYDVESNSTIWSAATRSEDFFETFPTFSPDGKWLYFCRAEAVDDVIHNYSSVKYAVARVQFDGTKPGEDAEIIYDTPAEGASASFPRISPDGRWLIFTKHAYGNFSIWHKSADLCMLDLKSGRTVDIDAANSADTESYHSWDSGSRWIVFSSRRDDGLYTKPYFAHIEDDGSISKPFLLPQKNPKEDYGKLMFSYNLPQFMISPVPYSPEELSSSLKDGRRINVH